MKIYFLFVLEVAISQVIDKPTHVRVSLYEPEGLFVQWRVVGNHQGHPIVGYKIRVWKIEEDLHGTYTLLNGEQLAIISDERSVEPYNIEVPKHPPREYTTPNIDIKNDLSIKITDGINYNTLYEVRVLAYRKDLDGPMSQPIRVKIVKEDGYTVLAQKTSPNTCTISSISETTPEYGVQYYSIETVNL
ncbi:unnamed protein product [Pieris macdunnoughi]|uniref:Fibronectin type-III domain-containing protein n=1 Tax=Pieris macdunnoughi TaxID=345717 RepID=A0A821WP85_9NEOP|nr:unnamed protein product [Pieris macdunnoughi]